MNYGNQWSINFLVLDLVSGVEPICFMGNSTSTSGNYLYGSVSIPNNQNTGFHDLEVYDHNSNQWIQKIMLFILVTHHLLLR